MGARLPAGEVEAAVVSQIRALLQSPEVVVATWRSARLEIDGQTEAEVREALEQFDPLWDELFPTEQARIVRLLVDRVRVVPDGIDITLREGSVARLIAELLAQEREAA